MIDFKELDKHLYGNPNQPAKPKVSVCFITYNHAKYIEQALDSILSQQINFTFEIVIGDDCSTDGTSEIVKKYADKYPHIVRAYIHPENLIKYGSPGKFNFTHAFSQCRGEYVTHFEGDDYYIDDYKFQKQADYLDKHSECSACFHNALMKFEDGSGREDYNINPPDQPKLTTVHDLLKEREIWFMATASVMLRKQVIGDKFPAWFFETKSGDIPLYILLADSAAIGYLPDVMSVYRRNSAGLSYTDSNFDWAFLQNRIEMYENLNRHTEGKYQQQIYPFLSEYYYMGLKTSALANSQKQRAIAYLKAKYYGELPKVSSWKDMLTLDNQARLNKLRKIIGFG
ncbi:MAG: glycosyltransferase involved in cell wall biosynthesis [Spirosomataceae bacterium]|jgi:glycosyltransferase involved in cell wall biosynthesis